jgi:hypothetical protein
MPNSSLLQLVARGRQDAYLTNNPQFTFFKHVYRRYTPFAIESIPIEFDGTADFGRRISVVVPRKAELLWSLFLEINLPAIPVNPLDQTPRYWANDIGHAMIQDVSIEIGEKEIDKHTGEWLQIWSELTMPSEKRDGFHQMVGHWDVYPIQDARGPLNLTIPLRFWFCNMIGAALPLIALQAHPVRLIIHLAPFHKLWYSPNLCNVVPLCPSIESVPPDSFQLYADYVFLDTEERRRFAAIEHEYLIEQVQYSPPQSIAAGVLSANVEIIFNHCVKEFIWVIQQDRMQNTNEWFNYANVSLCDTRGLKTDLLASAIIRLDGYDRFYQRRALYFRQTQPYQYHTNIPNNFIYMYSFCLKPESEQPSGSLNCSKIDDVRLALTFNAAQVSQPRHVVVYGTNYNILRIVGGLGGLAFYS